MKFQSLLLGSSLLFSVSGFAEYFSCVFTEPMQVIFGSTEFGIATQYMPMSGIEMFRNFKVERSNGVMTLGLSETATLKIDKNKVGNDGMSDRIFPYEGILTTGRGSEFGGCSSEVKVDSTTLVERWPSWNYALGLSFVNYWPGEYGNVMGVKSERKVTIPETATWSSVRDNVMANKKCTVSKGKMFVPAKAKAGEIYGALTNVTKETAAYEDPNLGIAQKDEVYSIAYSGEGICLVEYRGKFGFSDCPVTEQGSVAPGAQAQPNGGMTDAPLGNWVFTKCNEGYWVWINENTLRETPGFSSVLLPL